MKLPFDLSNLTHGLLAHMAPEILKGIFGEILGKVSLNEVIDWVNADKSLWKTMGADHQAQCKTYVPKVSDWSWFTAEWLISELAPDYPSICSLFLGWKKANNWLHRQIKEFKKECGIELETSDEKTYSSSK